MQIGVEKNTPQRGRRGGLQCSEQGYYPVCSSLPSQRGGITKPLDFAAAATVAFQILFGGVKGVLYPFSSESASLP